MMQAILTDIRKGYDFDGNLAGVNGTFEFRDPSGHGRILQVHVSLLARGLAPRHLLGRPGDQLGQGIRGGDRRPDCFGSRPVRTTHQLWAGR